MIRIPLTDEDSFVEWDDEYGGQIGIYCKINKAEQLKKQILDDYENVTEWKKLGGAGNWKSVSLEELKELKEKAEKWDESLEHAPCGTLLFQTVHKLEQENKQLKEQRDKLRNNLNTANIVIDQLREEYSER